VKQAAKGWQELLTLGWLESYLDPPRVPRPKQRKAVFLIAEPTQKLTPRQQEILDVLRHHGGQMWLSELLQTCQASSSTVQALVRAGCAAIEQRELLRLATDSETLKRDRPKALNRWQQAALEQLQGLTGYRRVLLHGVTGSGKTEVYLQAIAPVLARGLSVLVLVPEIGLTPQIVDRFRARFEWRVCLYHSGLSEGERYDTWRQMLTGEPQVVIGTRSAIFAPLPRVGLIAIDEEHDASYKQVQTAPLYHAGTVAAWRAQLEDCPLILGSATPALTTWADREKLYLPLPERINARPLPPIEVVDLRQELAQGNRSIFSQALQAAIATVLAKNEQGILFVPRRGHSTFVSCRSCGYVLECPACDVALSYHYTHTGARERLRCHYCNHQQAQPRHCPACGSPYLKHFGSGTQRVVLELQNLFPEIRCLRFDRDTTRTKGAHRALLDRFARGEADFLVGTQMLTKGIDCDRVTLVGVMAADGLLFRADYRATERAFQTLMQVAGRAGRGEAPGRVSIQTYAPEHPVLAAVQALSYDRFATEVLAERAANGYPPYGKLILLQLSGPDERQVQNTAGSLAATCAGICAPANGRVLGPAPAAIARVAQR
ncbi:MAG: primosomal protein N', partial [Cyanobacteria bacterium J06641_5]